MEKAKPKSAFPPKLYSNQLDEGYLKVKGDSKYMLTLGIEFTYTNDLEEALYFKKEEGIKGLNRLVIQNKGDLYHWCLCVINLDSILSLFLFFDCEKDYSNKFTFDHHGRLIYEENDQETYCLSNDFISPEFEKCSLDGRDDDIDKFQQFEFYSNTPPWEAPVGSW